MGDHTEGLAPLHVAARDGLAEPLLGLLAAKCSIDIRDKIGNTPLHHAGTLLLYYYILLIVFSVANKRTDTVRWLLKKGADREIANDQGKTPLQLAEQHEFLDIVGLLKK